MIAAGVAACISGVVWNLGSTLKSNFYDKLAIAIALTIRSKALVSGVTQEPSNPGLLVEQVGGVSIDLSWSLGHRA